MKKDDSPLTDKGRKTRQKLYDVAIQLFREEGFEATTMRQIADQAGVSTGLLYRYFPGKHALVLALYEELSNAFASRADELPEGTWARRVTAAVTLSLSTLESHYSVLQALIPTLITDPEEGLLGTRTEEARQQVQRVFEEAVHGAENAPQKDDVAKAVARLAYVAHLGVILGWLIDRSPDQRATHNLLELLNSVAPMLSIGLNLPVVQDFVLRANDLIGQALFP